MINYVVVLVCAWMVVTFITTAFFRVMFFLFVGNWEGAPVIVLLGVVSAIVVASCCIAKSFDDFS